MSLTTSGHDSGPDHAAASPFTDYSAAYYLGLLTVQPAGDHVDREYADMARDQHQAANTQIYTTGDGVERLDAPLVAKLDESYFPVVASDDIPPDVLAVPDDILAESHVDNPPTRTEILVAKADRAAQYLEWYTPYTIASAVMA